MTDSSNEDNLDSQLQQRPDSLLELVDALKRPMYERLRSALELGKWQDGQRLTPAQQEQVMQLVMLYELRQLPAGEGSFANLPQGCGAGPDVSLFDPRES